MIKHSVIYTFKSSVNDKEKQSFFEAASSLSAIPGVKNFEMLKQVSPKNKYEYGIAMVFDNAQTYEDYNTHPAHQEFLEKYWFVYIEEFLEIDYEALNTL